MSNKSPTNPKGAGRPNSKKITIPVRCVDDAEVIKYVRNCAKEKSEEYVKQSKDEKI